MEEVPIHECRYNRFLKDYTYKHVRLNSWKAIGERFGLDATQKEDIKTFAPLVVDLPQVVFLCLSCYEKNNETPTKTGFEKVYSCGRGHKECNISLGLNRALSSYQTNKTIISDLHYRSQSFGSPPIFSAVANDRESHFFFPTKML